MDRNYSPDVSETLPPYSEDGTPGYFNDGTTITPQWCNQITEELRNVLIAAGITPSCMSDTQLVEALSGALAAIGHATDTGVVTTPLRRSVIASSSSKATGGDSAVIASMTSQALNGQAMVLASLLCKAWALGSVVVGSGGCNQSAAATRSVMLASLGCENIEPNTVVIGYSTDELTPNGTNQHRQIVFRAITGEIATVGDINAEGSIGAGGAVVGGLIQSTGDLSVVDDAGINGDLDVGGAATADSLHMPSGSNEVSDRLTGPTSIDAHSHVDIVEINSRVAANAHLFVSLHISGGADDAAPLVASIYNQEDGGFVIRVQNVGDSAFSGTTTVDYWILNPKAA
ncbi:MAG: hypothetical protein KBD01_19870 [Acidobacteria bacterium]|nr:hypothetical protein [Acidobacteriota bacterium]